MQLRVGMSRQQYQRLESRGNPRLDTLELVAKGLKMEVLLIPQEKYRSANYQQIAKVLYQYAGDGLGDVQQLVRRLLVNILLANGDAHLKNWSVLYPDTVTASLAPAYDIVTTRVYMNDEREFALNLGKSRDWFQVSLAQFEYWAGKAGGLPWRAIKPHLLDTMEGARTLWSAALQDLPMDNTHKRELGSHWKKLHPDFRIAR